MLGLVYDWSTTGNRPFIGGSAGIARLAPSEGLSTETHPAFAFIGGYKMAVSNKIFLRGHVRLAFTKMPEGSLFTEEYQHHKETFMPQFQVGFGIGAPL
jgi:hypothetical protein